MITATVNAHEVGLVTDDELVAGTFRHYTLNAVFDSCWDGLAKRVSFTNGRVTVPMDYEDGMYVPDDVMFAGSLEIGFTGVRQDGAEVIRTMKVVGLEIARSQRDLPRAQMDKALDVVEKARQRLDDLDAEIPKITEDYLNTKDRWQGEIDDAAWKSIAQTNASKASEEQRQQTFASKMNDCGG